MRKFVFAAFACIVFISAGYSQVPTLNPTCAYRPILEDLRAYEDSLALANSVPVVREDYSLPGSNPASSGGKVYRIYRCSALLDSLTVLIGEVMFARATPPVVDTDSISGVTGTAAVFYAKVTSDGGQAVTAQWFRYGTSAASLVDSVAVAGTVTPFTASVISLTAGTTYYVAGFARNAKGTSSGDTLTFTTLAAPSVDTDAASDVLENSATLNATFTDGGSEVTATGFKYGADAALSTPTNVVGSGTTSPFTAALTGLTASTQYWAVGYATNAVGTSYGDTITFTTSAGSPPPPPPSPSSSFACGTSTVTYDGYSYTTVPIGSQCWFAENLRNENYADGTPIPGNLDATAWTNATAGAQAVYGQGGANEATNLAKYGRLYNWYAVNDPAGLCPTGWHVPTDAEWTTLETQQGGASVAGDKLKASSPDWDGTNTSGLRVLPAGLRAQSGQFANEGSSAFLWSSSVSGTNSVYLYLYSGGSFVSHPGSIPRSGNSVRCMQEMVAPTVDTDVAGSVTDTEATLNATITTTGGSAVTATGFKYGTDAVLSSPTGVAGSGTTSPFTAALTGLTASTQYWAVGYATNAVGTSYGDTITFTTSAGSPPPPPPPSSFACGTSTVTYDGHNYLTVQIGSQCWFAENLRNENYADGTPIPGNLDATAWSNATAGAQAVYDQGGPNEASKFAAYGRLYNWYAVNTGNLCPSGWHVPTKAEWTTLWNSAGNSDDLKASDPTWDGYDSYGFTALPGGYRYWDGNFYDEYLSASFWTSTPETIGAWSMNLIGADTGLYTYDDDVTMGLSVRCIQD